MKRLVRRMICFSKKNQKNKGWQRTLVKWNRKIDFLKWIETPFLRSSPIEVCSVCFMFDYRWLLWLSWWLSRMTSWASFPYPLLYPNSSWRLWSWTRWEVNLNTRVDRGRCTCGERPKYQLLIEDIQNYVLCNIIPCRAWGSVTSAFGGYERPRVSGCAWVHPEPGEVCTWILLAHNPYSYLTRCIFYIRYSISVGSCG